MFLCCLLVCARVCVIAGAYADVCCNVVVNITDFTEYYNRCCRSCSHPKPFSLFIHSLILVAYTRGCGRRLIRFVLPSLYFLVHINDITSQQPPFLSLLLLIVPLRAPPLLRVLFCWAIPCDDHPATFALRISIITPTLFAGSALSKAEALEVDVVRAVVVGDSKLQNYSLPPSFSSSLRPTYNSIHIYSSSSLLCRCV